MAKGGSRISECSRIESFERGGYAGSGRGLLAAKSLRRSREDFARGTEAGRKILARIFHPGTSLFGSGEYSEGSTSYRPHAAVEAGLCRSASAGGKCSAES